MNTENIQMDTLEEIISPEEENGQYTFSKKSVLTKQVDPELESLFGKYKRGKLVLQPDFQRQFVWDSAKSSRLIESTLLDIPLPVIYLSEESDGKETGS